MAYKTSNNHGNLFKNREKSLDSHPDLNGEINVDGVAYFIDGWYNEGSSGRYVSLRVKRKNRQPVITNEDMEII